MEASTPRCISIFPFGIRLQAYQSGARATLSASRKGYAEPDHCGHFQKLATFGKIGLKGRLPKDFRNPKNFSHESTFGVEGFLGRVPRSSQLKNNHLAEM